MTLGIIIITCLILLGVALMMAEIFLLPGITIAGLGGGMLMILSVVYAFYYVNDTVGYITIAANIILGVGAFMFLIKSNALDRIALNTNIDATVDQTEIKQLEIGYTGVALSRLNPMGKASFRDLIVEVRSITGEFIDAEMPIEIVKIENSNVYVDAVHQKKQI
ncbi:MAG: hypothetical protein RL662_1109 [Bacteroidota bacterium]|jgi:membrane-bound ClpP family serine protease